MSKNTTVNYTPEMEAEMKEAYKAAWGDAERAEVVGAMAAKFGKSLQSIRSKMSRSGYYKKPERVTKAGGVVIKKAELVDKIAEKLNVPAERIESLEKATKDVLSLVLENL
jgi:hypothetical protein